MADLYDNVARLAQVLAHPVRVQILNLLREEGSAYVMHLTASTARPQANISQHLAILREAGLITDERDGMSVIYRVADRRVYEVLDGLAGLTASEAGAGRSFTSMMRAGQRPHGCGCPRCRDRR